MFTISWIFHLCHYVRFTSNNILNKQDLQTKFVFLFVSESPDTEAAMDLGASEVMESEVLYDCVICGQSGPSTEDRPTGLVVLLQASSGMAFISILTLILRC